VAFPKILKKIKKKYIEEMPPDLLVPPSPD